MKRSTKWLIAIAVLAIFFGQYGHIMYSWVGLDTDGYTADMKGKKVAYKLHGAYKQAEIDNCFRKIGIDPDDLDDLLEKIKSGAVTASPALKRCIEKKANGYASPKKDLGNALTGLKKIVAGKPEPQLIKTIHYNPRKYGVGGMPINIGEYSYYKCSGRYHQSWSDGGGRWIGCGGIYNDKIPRWAIKLMPRENPKIYGKALVNNRNININIVQRDESYADIYGELTIRFYN